MSRLLCDARAGGAAADARGGCWRQAASLDAADASGSWALSPDAGERSPAALLGSPAAPGEPPLAALASDGAALVGCLGRLAALRADRTLSRREFAAAKATLLARWEANGSSTQANGSSTQANGSSTQANGSSTQEAIDPDALVERSGHSRHAGEIFPPRRRVACACTLQ